MRLLELIFREGLEIVKNQ